MTEWYKEEYTKHWAQTFEVDRWIYRGQTAFQKVEIFENEMVGRVLVLDGIIQSAEVDEFVYHEMLAHVPILAHGAVRKVLIIGGGDGSMLRHALMHPDIEVTMVDIDPEVVALCREHLPNHNAGAFDHPRGRYIAGDGCAFVRDTEDRFDVIIIDSTDPLGGPGDILFSEGFYRDCKGCMTEGGILTMQSGVPAFEKPRIRTLKRNLGGVFDDFTVYLAPVPTYYGGFMAFGWGSDQAAHRQVEEADLRRRLEAANIDCSYYTPTIHKASFAHPKFLEDLLTN